jgi:hypothetical protein
MIYFFSKQDCLILRPFAFIQVNAKNCVINFMGTISNTDICYLDIDFTFIQKIYLVFHGLSALATLGLFIVKFLIRSRNEIMRNNFPTVLATLSTGKYENNSLKNFENT